MKIAGIWIYPIKSCQGISLSAHEMLPTGLRHDRQWMLVDEHGKFLTQREYPEMASVLVKLENENLFIQDGGRRISLEGPSEEVQRVEIWSHKPKAHLEKNPEAQKFFADLTGKNVKLMTVGPEFHRKVTERGEITEATQLFADAHPLHLVSESSLRDLNAKLKEPIPVERFRANLVVSGDFEPYAEDSWKDLQAGSLRLQMRRLCSRCVIINFDQETGEKKSSEPLRVLSGYKRVANKVFFGVRGWSENSGVIRLGDEVRVLSYKKG